MVEVRRRLSEAKVREAVRIATEIIRVGEARGELGVIEWSKQNTRLWNEAHGAKLTDLVRSELRKRLT